MPGFSEVSITGRLAFAEILLGERSQITFRGTRIGITATATKTRRLPTDYGAGALLPISVLDRKLRSHLPSLPRVLDVLAFLESHRYGIQAIICAPSTKRRESSGWVCRWPTQLTPDACRSPERHC